MSPTCRTTARMTGIESLGWRLFADGGCTRPIHGTEMAGWRVRRVSLEKFVWVICGPIVCDPRVPTFLGATSCSNNTAELTGLAEALRILFRSKHAARVTLGVAHAKKNIALARRCNELLCRLKCNVHLSAHHVFRHAGNAGNECAGAAPSLGMRYFISENNVPLFYFA